MRHKTSKRLAAVGATFALALGAGTATAWASHGADDPVGDDHGALVEPGDDNGVHAQPGDDNGGRGNNGRHHRHHHHQHGGHDDGPNHT